MDILILLFVGWSISSILVNGSIFDNIRNWLLVKHPTVGSLLSCIQCTGFWVGLILLVPVMCMYYINPILNSRFPFIINVTILPFIQSGFNIIMESLMIFLIKRNK